jgi:hypothetical protein
MERKLRYARLTNKDSWGGWKTYSLILSYTDRENSDMVILIEY